MIIQIPFHILEYNSVKLHKASSPEFDYRSLNSTGVTQNECDLS